MEYFRQPLRPDLLADRDESKETDVDPDADFRADANFGVPERSRFRLRVPRFTRIPRLRREPRFRAEPPLPGVARSSDSPAILFGLDRKTLAIIGVGFLLVVGSVAAFALSGGERTAAGDAPPLSTVTTFPAFPTASVMPPADADEQPDGGVILAPELTGDEGEDSEPGGDPDPVAEPPDSDADPDSDAPEPAPSAGQPQNSGSGRVAGSAYLPVKGYVITSAYAQAGNWTTGHHTGVDLAVRVGTPVVAMLPGTVLMSATDASYGNYVLIRHAEHEYSLYAHLSRLDVRQGATVSAGGRVGLSGATGNVTGPHLHFEVRTEPVFGSDIDPVAYLANHDVQL
ncbi:M23 family metallopeptidase [Streptomyces sp. NPDC127119]|uniref:M23 family metallopeptidase n=1 Tax=Streptomyces sp. NPDC127119 TaxID=3345370 RepID=UPI00363B9F5D